MEQFPEFVGNHMVLFSLLVVIVIALAMNIWASIGVAGKQVTGQALIGLINHETGTVLDVREREAFERGHILDALHIPLKKLPDNLGELEKHKDSPLVICCQTGNASAQASGILAKSGHTNLYRLQGGISAWQSDNLPLTRD